MISITSVLLMYAATVKAATIYSLASVANFSPQLDPAPVGVSFEFFAFPTFVNNIASTGTCLANIRDVMGTPAPIRVGGSSQDRATYDPASTAPVTYSVANPADTPSSLTFGPSFFDVANRYIGQTTIGLNRRQNNLNNTVAAAARARGVVKNLYAIELGNEPDFYTTSDPIATNGRWDPATDIASQTAWQQSVATALNTPNIIQAGVYLQPPTWSTANLAPREGGSAQYVKSFSGHSYPQNACNGAGTNLQTLMQHSGIVGYTARFKPEVQAANAIGKVYQFGETNSASCGGGAISPTFGAGLWIVDYVMQSMMIGVRQLFFHQSTFQNCLSCLWSQNGVAAPFYGAYFVAKALGGANIIAMLDDGTSNYAAYAIYKGQNVIRLLLVNTDYFTGGKRPMQAFSFTSLPASTTSATVHRLTAPSAASRQDQGSVPTVGGLSFQDGSCAIIGTETTETVAVSGGAATFSVGASEALLVTL